MEIKDAKYNVSALAIDPILSDKSISSGVKLVLLSLIHRLGGKNYAFPSQKRIAKNIGLSERQVRNHLRLLKEKGVITWSRGVTNPRTKKVANVNSYNLSKILVQRHNE